MCAAPHALAPVRRALRVRGMRRAERRASRAGPGTGDPGRVLARRRRRFRQDARRAQCRRAPRAGVADQADDRVRRVRRPRARRAALGRHRHGGRRRHRLRRPRRGAHVSDARAARSRARPDARPDRRLRERRGARAREAHRRQPRRLRDDDERHGAPARHARFALRVAVRHHDARSLFDRARPVDSRAASEPRFPGVLHVLVATAFRVRRVREDQQESSARRRSERRRHEDRPYERSRMVHGRHREAARRRRARGTA
ncbi:putative dacA protein [Burkholderia pseudomallei TSV 31]|nr:putative dacA protein [Burkholderia pseudomallei TSV 43]KGV34148.1 putative dacA protein [Burkholderia pseudomallei TSV 31]